MAQPETQEKIPFLYEQRTLNRLKASYLHSAHAPYTELPCNLENILRYCLVHVFQQQMEL